MVYNKFAFLKEIQIESEIFHSMYTGLQLYNSSNVLMVTYHLITITMKINRLVKTKTKQNKLTNKQTVMLVKNILTVTEPARNRS